MNRNRKTKIKTTKKALLLILTICMVLSTSGIAQADTTAVALNEVGIAQGQTSASLADSIEWQASATEHNCGYEPIKAVCIGYVTEQSVEQSAEQDIDDTEKSAEQDGMAVAQVTFPTLDASTGADEEGDASQTTKPVDTTPIITLDTTQERYCEQQIAKTDWDGKLRNLYAIIRDGINSQLPEIKIDVDGRSETADDYTPDEVHKVFKAVMEDYPELFWMRGGYGYKPYLTNGAIAFILPNYLFSEKSDTVAANASFEQAVNSILTQIESEDDFALYTDYEKELWIHDYIARNCVYELYATHAHSAYGMLVEGKAVCEGYTRAFQLLLNKLGIQCSTVTGTDDVDGTDENHIWNVVKLDGKWYQVDLTWDDQGETGDEKIYYSYFNLPSSMMYDDHKPLGNCVEIPTCDSMRYWYFNVNAEHALVLADYTTKDDYAKLAAKIAGFIEEYGYARLYVLDADKDADDLYNLYSTKLKDLYDTKDDAEASENKRFIHLVATELKVKAGTGFRYGSDSSSNKKEQILHMTYTSSGSGSGSGDTGETSTVSDLGDIDGNGKVDFVDTMILIRHLARWGGAYDNIDVSKGDINGNGEIDLLDIIHIERYVARYTSHLNLLKVENDA